MSLGCALSACGGGGGGSPAPVNQSAPAPVPTPAKIIAIDAEGDSTYYGTQVINGVVTRTANNPPALLQQMFGTAVTVTNSAAGGATILEALNGIAPRYATTLSARLQTLKPQYVASNFVINDSLHEAEADYLSGLAAWIATVRANGATPILEEPNPVCDGKAPNLDQYVYDLRQVAAQQGVTLIAQYDYIKSLPGWEAMLTDCVHPTDALYQIKAQREYAVLQPLVEKLP
ncbi:SGNH/GDSL hydrolase family protein [Paraburkholderia dipogonis]|uniref:SGNH/GDSL hydrolase family protein n=1 Tax=Paraburkholderia dipogonis TaxID=1211383 RepID=UPI0038BD8261